MAKNDLAIDRELNSNIIVIKFRKKVIIIPWKNLCVIPACGGSPRVSCRRPIERVSDLEGQPAQTPQEASGASPRIAVSESRKM